MKQKHKHESGVTCDELQSGTEPEHNCESESDMEKIKKFLII